MAIADLSFPRSLPEFQRQFPDDAACAAYLETARWREGFICPHCNVKTEVTDPNIWWHRSSDNGR